jgi:hypothetical protein
MDWNNWGNDRKKKQPLSCKPPEKIISWQTAKQVFSTMFFCSPQAIAQLVVITTEWYGSSRRGVVVTNYKLRGHRFSQQQWCILLALAWRWKQPARLKRWYRYKNLHVFISQKTRNLNYTPTSETCRTDNGKIRQCSQQLCFNLN